MNKIIFIPILCLLFISGCDDEKNDPFIGKWNYSQLGVTFELRSAGNSYSIENVTVGGESWTRKELIDVSAGELIGKIIISKTPSSTEVISLMACRPAGGSIASDSVWRISNNTKTSYYNQTIIKVK